ncbi:MAG: hypothetical protein JWM74_853 [Myxococcaceae bacterium]|jgi:ABC-type transport system involved in cytochrome c biogenesis permease subunit|nr:hypothetical protein [Myxococcaceae bacterium]
MAKLILLSVILFSVIVPIVFAKTKSPKRTLRGIQIATLVSVAIWAFLCLTFYPAMVPIE